MKTRALMFVKLLATEETGARVLFAIPEPARILRVPTTVHAAASAAGTPPPASVSLFVDFGEVSLADAATQLGAKRHDSFDWAAGDAGAKCTLFEMALTSGAEENLPSTLTWPGPATWHVRWLPFPLAVRALTDGTDRRYLQLAVQYISAGGVDENVIAADTGGGLLTQLAAALEAQGEKPD